MANMRETTRCLTWLARTIERTLERADSLEGFVEALVFVAFEPSERLEIHDRLRRLPRRRGPSS